MIEIVADDQDAKKGLENVKDELEKVEESTGDAARELTDAAKSVEELGDAAEKSGKQMDSAGENVDDFGKAAEDAGDQAEKSAEAVGSLAKGAAVVAGTLLAAGAAAVSCATDFDAAFAKTQTIMDQTKVSVSEMSDDIMALSGSSAMAATDVSDAVYNAISGSVATEDAVEFVDQANRLAVAGFTDLANATDVMTTVLNAYGLEASYVGGISNVLITTQNLGKTTVDALASSMGKAISTGSAYGVNMQNLASAYVELTRGGIDTAEATTYLSGMLNELGNASSEVGKIIQEKTGMSFGQLMEQGWSLGDVLEVLADSVDGNAEALMGLWGSQEAGKASNAIMTQGVEDFNLVLAQMNEEMAGTTGTTEAAYETMTNTSEFINKKFTNSMTNLGIAVGSSVNPALDQAKLSLISVVEKVTDFANKHPAVVRALTAITIGVGAFAVALTVYTVGAKIATAATTALTTVMNSNPILLAVTAVISLGVAIGTYIATTQAAIEETEQLTAVSEQQRSELEELKAEYEQVCEAQGETSAEAQVLKQRLDDATEAFENNKRTVEELKEELNSTHEAFSALSDEIDNSFSSLDMEKQKTDALIDRMDELRNEEILSAEAKQELCAIIDLLNEQLPELGIQYDELTGKINLSTESIQAFSDASFQSAQREAALDYYKQLIGQQYELQYAAKVAKDEYDLAYQAYWDAAGRYSKEWAPGLSQQEVFDGERAGEGGNAIPATYFRNLINTAHDSYETAKNLYDQAESDLQDLEGQTEYVYGIIQETYGAAIVPDEVVEEIISPIDTWQEGVERLSEAYETAKETVRDSLDQQIGKWSEVDNKAKKSIDDIISALNSQITYFANYNKNLEIARTLGLNEEIIQALSDGSQESAAILAGIVEAANDANVDINEKIKELNDSWVGVSEGKDTLSESLAEYDETVIEEGDKLVELAASVGLDMSNAMTEGLLEGLPLFQQAWEQFVPPNGGAYGVGGSRLPGNEVVQHAYASGTASAAAGYAIVGEDGPELVFFRGGERVLTADETRQALGAVYPSAPQMRYVGAGAPAIAGGGAVQIRAVIDVPVQVDGREIARATAVYMGEEMEFEVM
ncbi:MAG: phage tail tape measure protein [Oscillospiraceae bacterium]|nr:phage tail tape measure protein [Oscillospiraceae bacterium]